MKSTKTETFSDLANDLLLTKAKTRLIEKESELDKAVKRVRDIRAQISFIKRLVRKMVSEMKILSIVTLLLLLCLWGKGQFAKFDNITSTRYITLDTAAILNDTFFIRTINRNQQLLIDSLKFESNRYKFLYEFLILQSFEEQHDTQDYQIDIEPIKPKYQ